MEVLCQWVEAVDPAFSSSAWYSLADSGAEGGSGLVFALDVAADHCTASIAVAWQRSDGGVHVMLADHREGVDWVAARCVELVDR